MLVVLNWRGAGRLTESGTRWERATLSSSDHHVVLEFNDLRPLQVR